MVIKDDDVGMYKCPKRQKHGVQMATNMTDEIELRENQAENLYTSAFKNLLASSTDASQDFVLCSLGNGGDSDLQSTLVIKKTRQAQAVEEDPSKTSTVATQQHTTDGGAQMDDEEPDTADQDMMSGLLQAFGKPQHHPKNVKAAKKTAAKSKASTTNSSSTPSGATRSHVTPAANVTPVVGGSNRSSTPFTSLSSVKGDSRDSLNKSINKRSIESVENTRSDDVNDGQKPSSTAPTCPSKWSLPDVPPTKRGRVSATTLQEADDRFLEEMERVIELICEARLPESSESDLIQYVKEGLAKTREIIGKCATKLSQMKRRKHSTEEDSQLHKLKEINNYAHLFSRLFTELSSATPKAGELDHIMGQLASPPLNFRSTA